MSVATITSKGQVTIPKEVRDRLGLHAGDKLSFQVEPDGGLRVTPVSRTIDDVFGLLSSKARKGIPVREMDERLRRAFRRRAR